MADRPDRGRRPPVQPTGSTRSAPAIKPVSGNRETVESFVFVFLFFLLLTVEAEGFVIPTGSMAPTLMGRQKELNCPQCDELYTVNVDREVNFGGVDSSPGARKVIAGVCSNCRFLTLVADEPNFRGDRIYVIKTPLDLPFVPALGKAVLERWDVAVFKLPEEPDVRYIKRLVGMPDEVLRIQRGDLWVRPRGSDSRFQRPARPLIHQEAMQIPVHDDLHRAKALGEEWTRWTPRTPGTWIESTTGSYQAKPIASPPAQATGESADGGDWTDLVYRHVVPDPVQWDAITRGERVPHPPRPTLITDFYSYNTDITPDSDSHPALSSKPWRQPHWVGDLTLSADLTVSEPKGAVRLELVKAGVVNRCEIDLSTGEATLWHGASKLAGPSATGIHHAGDYVLRFANVDDRLSLRVDGNLPFGEGVGFDPGEVFSPTAEDLAPARIGASGASVSVASLKITRDIYYSLKPSQSDVDALELNDPQPTDPVAFFDWMADPSRFLAFGKLTGSDFEIGPGHYMMLGDNSPWSRDGRAWERTDQRDPGGDPSRGWDDSGRESWEVPESLLIGKAFCVYWPHLKPFGPSWRFGQDIRLPARPYLERVRWIR